MAAKKWKLVCSYPHYLVGWSGNRRHQICWRTSRTKKACPEGMKCACIDTSWFKIGQFLQRHVEKKLWHCIICLTECEITCINAYIIIIGVDSLSLLLVEYSAPNMKEYWSLMIILAILFQVQLVLEFEELLPPVLRTKLRSGHKVVYPWKPKKIEWLRQEHESCELIEVILERKAHKLSGKHGKLHHEKYYHHTKHPVKHTAAYVSIVNK